MGSRQSTPSDADTSAAGSFSIDPSGNISHMRPRDKKEQEIQPEQEPQVEFQFQEIPDFSRLEREFNNSTNDEGDDTNTASHLGQDDYSTETAQEFERIEVEREKEEEEEDEAESRAGLAQMATFRSLPKTLPKLREDQMSLRDVDEIAARMKAKYKPKPADLAGKSIFEEMERNLVNCYKTNKDQPLQCAQLALEFKDFVQKQRDRVLSEAIRRESQIVS